MHSHCRDLLKRLQQRAGAGKGSRAFPGGYGALVAAAVEERVSAGKGGAASLLTRACFSSELEVHKWL
jgi:hypothetical protein